MESVGIGIGIAIAIGHRKLKADSDSDPDADPDAECAFPAALSGSYVKAFGFAGGYLLGMDMPAIRLIIGVASGFYGPNECLRSNTGI
jgi:hypothetical protein